MALLALTFVVIGSVVGGSPAHAADLACNNDDAPIPASPHGAGSWIVQLGESPKDADPFDDDGVTLESTYGTTPQLWTYDNGCTGQFVAGAGTAIGNILLQVSGTMPNWTHALLAAVVDPDSPVQALDNPVVDATRAVTDGVWRPWITIAVLLVAATAIWRARTGHIAGSATAVAWAGVVLLGTSLLISYPAESVRLVDDGVRNAVTLIATGFEDHPAPGEDPAVAAINGQMDEVVRSTQYRTWLTGALGDADSATAREYGPDLFRATHFTFDEYESYRSDPEGEGKAIVEEKQDSFKTIAGQIDREDSVAYEYFKGEHWGQRATAGLVNLVAVVVTCGYLLIAGLAILLAFVLIRLIVPFAPAAGILFMFDRTRDLAVGWLHRVIGPLVMGPIYFVVALCLLRFFSAVLTSAQVHYALKLAICAVLTYLAWRFTRPAAYGVGHIWGAAGFAWGTMTGWRRQRSPYREPAPPAAPIPGQPRVRPAVMEAAGPAPRQQIETRPSMPEPSGAMSTASDPTTNAITSTAAEVPAIPATGSKAIRAIWTDQGARDEWVREWTSRPGIATPERGSGPAYDFQRKHAGSDTIRLQADFGKTEIVADGLHVDPDDVVAVDAKYVLKPGSPKSMYEGKRPDFLLRDFDREMKRYSRVVRDTANPVSRIRIVTNTDLAGEFLGARARRMLGEDVDLTVDIQPSEETESLGDD
ncbi:restriction endonuclease fold toxin-2 domain-containing protein [Nocardioides sp. WG-D5]